MEYAGGGNIAGAIGFSSSLFINSCIIKNNASTGISFNLYNDGGTAVISNNTITQNVDRGGRGGGIDIVEPLSSNYIYITNNTITQNAVYSGLGDSYSGDGGGAGIGIFTGDTGTLYITGNTITQNYCVSQTFSRELIEVACDYGGGIYFHTLGHPVYINYNNIYGNMGHELYHFGGRNLDARYNWWGTTDDVTIQGGIYSRYGATDIPYTPYLSSPWENIPEGVKIYTNQTSYKAGDTLTLAYSISSA